MGDFNSWVSLKYGWLWIMRDFETWMTFNYGGLLIMGDFLLYEIGLTFWGMGQPLNYDYPFELLVNFWNMG